MRKIKCLLIFVVGIMSCTHTQKVDSVIDRFYSQDSVPGVSVILKNNNVPDYYAKGLANILDKYPIDSLTTFRMASVSKHFTAMAIYQLIKDGKLTFDTPVRTLLPELPSITKDITIAHFLNHSSGILDYENLIEAWRTIPLADADVLTYIQGTDSLYFVPGNSFRYSNTAYCLLALIVERVTAKTFPDAVQQLVLEPAGIKNATVYPTFDTEKRALGYHPHDNDFVFADQSITSSTKGDGGVYISAVEFGRWLANDNPLFDSGYWEAIDQHKIKVKDDIYYSLGWFVKYTNNGDRLLFHSGESTGFHNIVAFNPVNHQSISIFSNRDDFKIAELFEALAEENNLPATPKPLFNWLNKVYMNE